MLGAAGCGAAKQHAFDGFVDAGRYEDAARTFAEDTTLWNRPDALARASRMFSDPELPTYDPARARTVLERLALGFPLSREAELMSPLLPLMSAVAEVRAELTARQARLDSLALHADTLGASREAAERELQALQQRVRRLEVDLEAARLELERLKAIDLRRRPGTR